MLSRISATVVRRTAARFMSTEAAVASKMTLSFALPHETIYNAAQVESVILPGTEGEYGVTADHVPAVSELAPGVVQIDHGDGETEKYFIAGGFAFTHPDSHTEITCPEAVKLDDLDITAITQNYEAARAAFNSAESGSIAAAEAQIAVEVNKDMALALGVVLA